MNALALIIGNKEYLLRKNKLDNPINDANAIANKLLKLGYIVQKVTDCNKSQFAIAISKFTTDLENFDVGLFFFSGHGLQIDGENYLAPVDADFSDEKVAKYSSFPIKEILADMERASPKIKIVILDACRNNPFPSTYRGSYTKGLAPIYAPKGTILAYSTSPGETAMDGGGGKNSIYTKSLLKHIEDKNIPIENFFKRVRTTVHALSEGKQLSWEHTSLIGDYYFNSGQLIHSIDLSYNENVVADSRYEFDGSVVGQIIEQLKTYDWYQQEPAVRKIRRLDITSTDKNSQFILGRNILQTAIGGEFKALAYINNLGNELEKWTIDKENHVFNGILFEIFFDSNGRFRQGMNFKSNLINEICRLEEDKRYESSFNFINNQLQPFRDYLFYIPSTSPITLPLEFQLEKKKRKDDEGEYIAYTLKSILFQGTNILELDEDGSFYTTSTYDRFIEELSLKLCVPKNRLTISVNHEDDVEIIRKPVYYKIVIQ